MKVLLLLAALTTPVVAQDSGRLVFSNQESSERQMIAAFFHAVSSQTVSQDRIYAARIDLNGDDVDEVFGFVHSPYLCDGGRCTPLLYHKRADDVWVMILYRNDGPTGPKSRPEDWDVLPNPENGWLPLTVLGWKYTFTGEGYEPTSQLEAQSPQ